MLDSTRDPRLRSDPIPSLPDATVKLGTPRTLDGFGARLATLRRARGLSQEELAAHAGVSRRVIAYYEAESGQPPGALLVDLARVLHVSADELLGIVSVREHTPPKTARLLKRLSRIEELPPADQRAVLKLVDAMLDTRRRATPPMRAKRKAS
ncbi:MAG: helix-turn-helix domain-containing protein [Salinibacterium sp.]|nr:helix-turn-helix domain-containing protein [Salinibacterium sp.]